MRSLRTAFNPAQCLQCEFWPSAPIIQRHRMAPSRSRTHWSLRPTACVPQQSEMPISSARRTNRLWRAGRRKARPGSFGKSASTRAPTLRNRMPRHAAPSAYVRPTPNWRRAAIPSGSNPSPQALSMGGRAPSIRTTWNPRNRAAIAAARPAGPPPRTTISASDGRDANIVWRLRQT